MAIQRAAHGALHVGKLCGVQRAGHFCGELPSHAITPSGER